MLLKRLNLNTCVEIECESQNTLDSATENDLRPGSTGLQDSDTGALWHKVTISNEMKLRRK